MKIAVLREAGGLGDVVATEPAVRGLRNKYPDAEIWYLCLPEYESLVRGWPAPPDVYLAVNIHERRSRDEAVDTERWPYLAAIQNADLIVDLFCPAFQYERRKRHRTDKSRIRLFCEAAGVNPSCPRQKIDQKKYIWTEGFLAAQGRNPEKPLIGLQPIACGRRRNWPREKWAELSSRLIEDGAEVLVFHSFPAPVRDIPGMKATGLHLDHLAALVSQCQLMITPDSGFLHLSAALDVPTISLWGSTHPEITCEYYPYARHIWPARNRPWPEGCRAPCYSMGGCVSMLCHDRCRLLENLEMEEVLAQINR